MRDVIWSAGRLLLAWRRRPRAGRRRGKGDKKVPAVLNFKMKTLDGKDVDLSKYQGKVVLFVNVASKCGHTPQYEELRDAARQVRQGRPGHPRRAGQRVRQPGAGQRRARSPSSATSKYGVKFPMLSKVVVKGEGICPLYKYLTSKETDPKFAGDIKWNFTKFLVGRNGEVVARFEPKVKPDPQEVVKAIEAELKK